jgi:hypothetical protein
MLQVFVKTLDVYPKTITFQVFEEEVEMTVKNFKKRISDRVQFPSIGFRLFKGHRPLADSKLFLKNVQDLDTLWMQGISKNLWEKIDF